MKDIDDLIDGAAELAERGYTNGEIADELNVSRETASWLATRRDVDRLVPGRDDTRDIHVDWKTLGRDNTCLTHVGAAMATLLSEYGESVGLTVGIEKAGVPLATNIARELDTDLSTYTPRKHHWEEGDIEELSGTFSRNFATVDERKCYLVDDTITTGTTMAETINGIREADGVPVAGIVLVDKKGVKEINGVPVRSLIQLLRVGKSTSG